MKKYVFLVLLVLLINSVTAPGTGTGVGVDVDLEVAAPIVWVNPLTRLLFDDYTSPGAITAGGEHLIERQNNYAFEGEQLLWKVAVYDKNGKEDIDEVYISLLDEGTGDLFNVTDCDEIQDCHGIPEDNSCQTYNYTQCIDISGCSVVCDSYVDLAGVCDGNAPCYTSIQTAINSGSSYDLICVFTGTYTESLTLNKEVTIKAADSDTVTINGQHIITVDNVTLDNLIFVPGSGTAVLIDASATVIDDIQILNSVFDLTTSPSIGVHIGGLSPIMVEGVTMNHNTFNGPVDMICNPWKIGGEFGSPVSAQVEDVNFEQNTVNRCSIPINLHHADITDILINNNVFTNTDGVVYVWEDAGQSPTGILSEFVFTNNDIDSSNTYGVGIDTAVDEFTDANFGNGNLIQNNNIDDVPGGYGFEGVSILADLTNYELNAENNWWGCTLGPGNLDCSDVSADVDFAPWSDSAYTITTEQTTEAYLCSGEPDSCDIITNWYKCEEETPGCNWYSVPSTVDMWDNAIHITEFNDTTMQWYECLMTVATANNVHGEYKIRGVAEDTGGQVGNYDPSETWFLNPVIALGITGTIDFSTMNPGETKKSTPIIVGNAAETGSGVMLDMYIAGTDFYDTAHAGATCPTSNVLRLTNFRYYAVSGTYSTCNNAGADGECYDVIPYYMTGAGAPPNNNMQRVITDTTNLNLNEYPAGNVLSTGSDMTFTFKLTLPKPCTGGPFDDGEMMLYGEAV